MGEIHEDVVRRAEARVGSVVGGKYMLDTVIGVGGMAAVYAATHRNGNRVAVKMLHTALSMEADLRKRLLREGYVANAVSHPGVVRVLDDAVAEDGSIFLVMDLVVGASVEAISEAHAGKLSAEAVSSIAYQLLDIVVAAHENGVIHRDIKPDNIFLTKSGKVMLLDFGVARMQDNAHATREGTTIGTPAFMAPEQALGKMKEIDALSDVFSVGAVMFTLLTGRFVHEGESSNELLVLAATHRATDVREVEKSVPKEVADVVMRALAFEKEVRWQSARQMQEALKQAHEEAFGRPMLSGEALAVLLEGIEFVDLSQSKSEDDWPTLLSSPLASLPPPPVSSPESGELLVERRLPHFPVEDDVDRTAKWEPPRRRFRRIFFLGRDLFRWFDELWTRLWPYRLYVLALAGTFTFVMILFFYLMTSGQASGDKAKLHNGADQRPSVTIPINEEPVSSSSSLGVVDASAPSNSGSAIDINTLPSASKTPSKNPSSSSSRPRGKRHGGRRSTPHITHDDPFAHQ